MLAPVTLDCSIRLHCETEPGAAFVFGLLPARTHQQQLAMELLRVSGATAQSVFTDAASATRYLHVAARGGPLRVELDAQVRLLQTELDARSLHRDAHAVPLAAPESLRYLLPSRFCPSDRMAPIVERECLDGADEPFARAVAIEAWTRRHVAPLPPEPFAAGVDGTHAAPNALEVLERGAGTPRDLAHLTIALCRAARLPARYVTTVPFGDAGDGDLHPWVEVLVEQSWIAFDPGRRVPRTALLRLGTGRDAADVPLAIAHGAVAAGARVTWSVACLGATVETLAERDRHAEAICSATLGSLGEATRWHQEARLAARRPSHADPAAGAQRPAPSHAAAAAARVRSSEPRRGAQVLAFPAPQASRIPGESPGSRFEPV